MRKLMSAEKASEITKKYVEKEERYRFLTWLFNQEVNSAAKNGQNFIKMSEDIPDDFFKRIKKYGYNVDYVYQDNLGYYRYWKISWK